MKNKNYYGASRHFDRRPQKNSAQEVKQLLTGCYGKFIRGLGLAKQHGFQLDWKVILTSLDGERKFDYVVKHKLLTPKLAEFIAVNGSYALNAAYARLAKTQHYQRTTQEQEVWRRYQKALICDNKSFKHFQAFYYHYRFDEDMEVLLLKVRLDNENDFADDWLDLYLYHDLKPAAVSYLAKSKNMERWTAYCREHEVEAKYRRQHYQARVWRWIRNIFS